MGINKICAATLGAAMVLASAGAGFAQTTGGGVTPGTGNTGNPSNDPAVIQQDTTGTVQGGGAMNGTTNPGLKPGKDCGMKGENQGTTQTDAQMNCE